MCYFCAKTWTILGYLASQIRIYWLGYRTWNNRLISSFDPTILLARSKNRDFTLLNPEKKFKVWEKEVDYLWSSLPGRELQRGSNNGLNCITSSWEIPSGLWWNLGIEKWEFVSHGIDFQEWESWGEKTLSARSLECLQNVISHNEWVNIFGIL
jgi:hypothetical protein